MTKLNDELKYLVSDYGAFVPVEDSNYPIETIEDAIEAYLNSQDLNELFDCGPDYFTDEDQTYIIFNNELYDVTVRCLIDSSKNMPNCSRMYWFDGIDKSTYKLVPKDQYPKKKAYNQYVLTVSLVDNRSIENLCESIRNITGVNSVEVNK